MLQKKITFCQENCTLQKRLSKINNQMIKIKELEDEMILLEEMINENGLLLKDFSINNVFSICRHAFKKYQPISAIENFIPQDQP